MTTVKDKTKSKTSFWLKELYSLALIALAVFTFKSIFFANYTVPTGSMEPIILPGDKLLVNKLAYKLRVPFTQKTIYEFDTPKRGEIIVFDYPGDPSINYVKRLIGLPGDKIKVLDGQITVNNKEYKISISEDDSAIDDLCIQNYNDLPSLFIRIYPVDLSSGTWWLDHSIDFNMYYMDNVFLSKK